MRKALILAVMGLFLGSALSKATDLPIVTHYALDVQFLLQQNRIRVSAVIVVKNSTAQAQSELPFILYRLFSVSQVTDSRGNPLQFRQNIVQLQDEPSMQVRELLVHLPAPLKPHDSAQITLVYEGLMLGYAEVMQYVKDRVDEEYALLRPDALAYPLLCRSTFESMLSAFNTRFTYQIDATVPRGYTVACGGALVDSRATADSVTFVFRSKVPTWRMDIAAAKFSEMKNPEDQLVVYYLPDDSAGARRVLHASKDVIALYSRMFGRPTSFQGYTVIEIPDGWGSQASDYYFLQTAAAFKDSTKIGEVYHEVGHTWNAKPSQEIQRCRWFDEAFASFFEALALRAFQGKRAFEEDMETSRDLFVRWVNHDKEIFQTPIADYGKKELGRHSYTKGAWSLYVLYELAGEETFNRIIRTMLAEFEGKTIDFVGFQKLCERVTKKNLDKFFQEWIYGLESSKLLVEKTPVSEIVKRY